MLKEAVLNQLGYKPNEALLKQLELVEQNTQGYEKIIKHTMDLHEHLKVDGSYIALSNSVNSFKIKIEAQSKALEDEAHAKVQRYSEKFKVNIKKLENKNTYYIVGFEH